MKRFAALVCALALCLALPACDFNATPSTASSSDASTASSTQPSTSTEASSSESSTQASTDEQASTAASTKSKTDKNKSKKKSKAKKPDYSTGIHHARIRIEGYGSIFIEIYPEFAPKTCEKFCKLVEKKYYDGMSIYKILPDMYINLGDRSGNTRYENIVPGEYEEAGFSNSLSLKRGTIAMSRTTSAAISSDASTIILALSDLSYLDGKYAAFAKVTRGMEIVDKICSRVNNGNKKNNIKTDKQGYVKKAKSCPVIKTIRMVD